MSFSTEVKEELLEHIPKGRHCQIAELAALIIVGFRGDSIPADKEYAYRKFFTLYNKTRNINKDMPKNDDQNLADIFKMTRVSEDFKICDEVIVQQACCKRSFIRGAFLAGGSISDPNKAYHFEIVCDTLAQAKLLIRIMSTFDVEPKYVARTGRYVVYLKEGAQIVEMLRVMEAPRSVLELENVRIVKEVRGSINRKVNCETANISKTVGAAVRQIEAIRYLDEEVGLINLPDSLQQIAQLRLEYPDTPLGDLGQLMDPPLGKSGVNHRLRRLTEMADKLRS